MQRGGEAAKSRSLVSRRAASLGMTGFRWRDDCEWHAEEDIEADPSRPLPTQIVGTGFGMTDFSSAQCLPARRYWVSMNFDCLCDDQ